MSATVRDMPKPSTNPLSLDAAVETRRAARSRSDGAPNEGDSPIFADTKIGTVPADPKIETVLADAGSAGAAERPRRGRRRFLIVITAVAVVGGAWYAYCAARFRNGRSTSGRR